MKILYIGNYRDGTGWGNACVNNILAIDSVGIDVVPRAITFEKGTQDYPTRVKELEQSSTEGCDVCIQHTLPHLYSYDGRYKNIGFAAVETSNFKDSGWHRHMNIMDEIWVPSTACKEACINSGVKVPVKVAPHSLDVSQYVDNNGNKIQNLLNTFNFAFVGEFVERKNLKALIRAFHMEFNYGEPVNLLIKTSKASLEDVQKYAAQIKMGLKIRQRYKEEIVIAGRLETADYISVLSQCHSFVMPSRGEGFCIPALEAMALGMPVIHTASNGMDDFCYGTAVRSYSQPCFGTTDTLSNIDTARSDWREIDIRALCSAMRKAFNRWVTGDMNKEKESAIERASKYSHSSIGAQLKELLNDK